VSSGYDLASVSRRAVLGALFCIVCSALGAASYAQPAPVQLIVDTDIDLDTDDALAIALLHALESRGEAKILAITISTDDEWAAPFASVLDTFYSHPDIPIGVIRHGSQPRSARELHQKMHYMFPYDYLRPLLERRRGDGSFAYPRRLQKRQQALDAVPLLRKTLGAQSDGSVTIVEIGQSTNLARLLESAADPISPLDGRTLISRKVKMLSIMSGSFFPSQFNGGKYAAGSPEWNLLVDPQSAQAVFERWPTPIVAEDCALSPTAVEPQSGADVDRQFGYVEDHPVLEDLHLFRATYAEGDNNILFNWPRAVGYCDEYAAFFAVRGESGYFSLSKPGTVTVLNDGSSRFKEVASGNHRFLMLDEKQRTRTPEAIALLRSEPPAEIVRGRSLNAIVFRQKSEEGITVRRN
jgi:inosine-uridine nucleoside N-ribohydrolase